MHCKSYYKISRETALRTSLIGDSHQTQPSKRLKNWEVQTVFFVALRRKIEYNTN